MMMTDDRNKVITLDQRRRGLRRTVKSEVVQARHDLAPATIVGRWKSRKRTELAKVMDKSRATLSKNAPAIGLAGVALLLFAGRKPILRVIKSFKERTTKS
jgi:hypothetical protein